MPLLLTLKDVALGLDQQCWIASFLWWMGWKTLLSEASLRVKKMNEIASKNQRERETDGVRLGKSHFLIGLPLILKVFCDFFFFGRSNNWICCRVLGPTGQSCPLGAHPLLETPFLAQLPLDGLWEHHLSLLTLQPKEVSSWWWHLPGLLILKKSGHPLFGFSAFPSSM